MSKVILKRPKDTTSFHNVSSVDQLFEKISLKYPDRRWELRREADGPAVTPSSLQECAALFVVHDGDGALASAPVSSS
jgi:hypothetical protein